MFTIKVIRWNTAELFSKAEKNTAFGAKLQAVAELDKIQNRAVEVFDSRLNKILSIEKKEKK